jgi:Zn-dependent protease with chaperone function
LIPQLSDFGVWLRLIIAAWLLQFSIWILFIVVIVMMPDEFCLSTMLLGCGAFALQIWIHCGLWIYLARLVRLLKEPPESLRRIVSQVATQMGRSCRGLWLMDSPISYAAALPMTGDLIFSKPIIADHPDVEIAAICAHEIGHLTESTRTKIGRLAGSFMFFPWLFAKPVAHQFGYPGLTGLAIITVLMMIFARRLARQMEVRADAVAHDHQAGEGIYARALERLYKNNQMPAVMRGDRKAHPHLYDRMLAAGVTPDYPRPAAPPNQAWNGILIWACLGMLGALYAFRQ